VRRRDRRPLEELLADGREHFGFDLWERAKPRHNLYVQLHRLEREGKVTRRWVATGEKRPSHRMAYRWVTDG